MNVLSDSGTVVDDRSDIVSVWSTLGKLSSNIKYQYVRDHRRLCSNRVYIPNMQSFVNLDTCTMKTGESICLSEVSSRVSSCSDLRKLTCEVIVDRCAVGSGKECVCRNEREGVGEMHC